MVVDSQSELHALGALAPIVGASAAMRRIVALAQRFAPADMPILLIGPTGTGKDLLARHIHAWSGRRGAFVDVNCSVIPRDLAEATLFGARRGAYTGSVEVLTGLVEAADGGTLFLNEACSLSLDAQVKLLDTLENGEYRVVGDHRKGRVEFRVIAAVQEGVGDKIAAGVFRLDLYERLAGGVIELPPLAERADDVVPLAEHFAAQRGQVLLPGSAAVLAEYDWPGNVRELRRVMERAGQLVEDGTIPPAALLEGIAMGARPIHTPGDAAKCSPVHNGLARQRLLAVLEETGWDTAAAARLLGVHRATVYRRMERVGVRPRWGDKGRAFASIRANSHAALRIRANGASPVESQPQA